MYSLSNLSKILKTCLFSLGGFLALGAGLERVNDRDPSVEGEDQTHDEINEIPRDQEPRDFSYPRIHGDMTEKGMSFSLTKSLKSLWRRNRGLEISFLEALTRRKLPKEELEALTRRDSPEKILDE